MLVPTAACGGSSTTSSTPAAASTSRNVPDHELYASNVKYALLDVLTNRGASAPVVSDVLCMWQSATVADCTTTAYDTDEANGQCGYTLLPCGTFQAHVHADCADAQGHDCTLGVE